MNAVNQQLSLVVLNSEQLEGGIQVQYQFDEQGGTLGASAQDDWQLKDRLGAVLPAHARIELQDGHFCLCDLSGQTFINGATSPIGRARKVHLEQGDELVVGPFRLRVYLGRVQAEPSVTQVLGTQPGDELNDWLDGEAHPPESHLSELEPADPLRALQQERRDNALLQPDDVAEPAILPPLSPFSALEDTMDQEFIDMPTVDHRHAPLSGQEEMDHVALTPLMRGLGQNLHSRDTLQAHAMLEEMGRTLRAMVEGLLTLQSEQAALADKHLRPIEDNPLRLGLDYADTLPLLFADGKSPVHLSAPSAVAEVLRNVRVHHSANQQAIAAALGSILEAFSPEALLGRFEHYRRSGTQEAMDEGWAWNMYQHYYRELTSTRQQGFEKLFHQVYAQAYDRAVRAEQGQNG